MENSNIYAFGFNDPNFSDVILKIRFIPDVDVPVRRSNSSSVSEIFADSLILASKSEKFKVMLANRVGGIRHQPIELSLKPFGCNSILFLHYSIYSLVLAVINILYLFMQMKQSFWICLDTYIAWTCNVQGLLILWLC
ncbi:hypothetical protein ACJIZ3_005264 [Penstemon smallii]|uniref:BTB domain-containing protein n=1 Tax=Penstemon smallii TaxID=265156 RepID=A0ABD3S4G7_9LAMI